MLPELQWTFHRIRSVQDIESLAPIYNSAPPSAAAFDTETTGLNIIDDSPFLFIFGWYCEDEGYGHVSFIAEYDMDMWEYQECIRIWNYLAGMAPVYLAHNTKFDLHMLYNLGLTYHGNNLSDSMFYIRFAHDNIPTRNGGVPLGLKPYATRYIDKNAGAYDKKLQQDRMRIAKEYNTILQRDLKKLPAPDDEKYKSWTKGYLNHLNQDSTFEITELRCDAYDVYMDWYEDVVPASVKKSMDSLLVKTKDIPYNMVDRAIMEFYACQDVIYVLELHRRCKKVIDQRGQNAGLELENQLIWPLWRMERVGFAVDEEYLHECKLNTRTYIIDRRAQLHQMVGEPLKVSQNKRIQALLAERYGLTVSTTNSETLTQILNDNANTEVAEFIEIIQELRTLEKWYSTYIIKWIKAITDGRVYTSINQVGTASGRVTSDFQQFPKDKLTTVDGRVLFEPRRMVQSEGAGLVYLDYSQIELRFQALYTILLNAPDLNLCRAYMPHECYMIPEYTPGVSDPLRQTIQFNYNELEHINNWEKYTWYHNEDNEEWHPVDLHGATTKAAFGITEDDPRYKKLRSYGKRVNFAKNYGAQRGRIAAMFPEMTEDEITRIDEAYYKAFPGIKVYQEYCYNIANAKPFVTNMFGIKYYGVSGHNLINMLIQGSAAYFLKQKIIEVDKYLLSECASEFQMNIHDELSFIWNEVDDFQIFYDLKEIMEYWPEAPMPIVADMEITKTTWADKEDV